MPHSQSYSEAQCPCDGAFADIDRADLSDDRLEGAKEIRDAYARSKSVAWTYRLLESGQIPARKENGQWTTYRSVLRHHRRRLIDRVPEWERAAHA